VICVDNAGNEASLDLGRVYKVIKPLANDGDYFLRVVDNEGEDYLYYAKQLVPVTLPARAKRAVELAVTSEA